MPSVKNHGWARFGAAPAVPYGGWMPACMSSRSGGHRSDGPTLKDDAARPPCAVLRLETDPAMQVDRKPNRWFQELLLFVLLVACLGAAVLAIGR